MAEQIPENMSQQDQQQAAQQQQAQLQSAPWIQEITAAEKYLEKFHTQGDKITDRYLDKREAAEETQNKYNLFWVNTQILLSTLYARFPKPLVTREFEDPDDAVARAAGIMSERLLRVRARDDFDESMKLCVQDRLVPGLGQLWFRYEPTFSTVEIPAVFDTEGNEVAPAGQAEQLVDEEVVTDYVYWKDFLWSPARVWREVRWVGRRIKISRADAEKRFGPTIAAGLKYSRGTSGETATSAQDAETAVVAYATIFEIWDKRSRTVVWVAKECTTVLDLKPDPYRGALPDFFPCPPPLRGLTATNSTVPRADYLMMQDQYQELDQINNRITLLERAIKVVGTYDSQNKEIGRIFSEGMDNTMIPTANFSQFQQSGGFKGSMDFMPIEMIVNALTRLREVKQELVAQIYELSGISDIMRGATRASETLGAQELKAQYGGVRLQYIQMEIGAFVEDALMIRSRMQLKLFQPSTILERTNIQFTDEAENAQAALQLMQSPSFKYRVEVRADSMAVPEFNAERDARMQFVRALAEMIGQSAPLIQTEPTAAPFLLKIMAWVATSFRTGREIEGVLEHFIAAAEQKALTPPPPPQPDPVQTSQASLNQAKTMKTTAEAVGITIENRLLGASPPPVPPAPPAPPFQIPLQPDQPGIPGTTPPVI